MESQGFSKVDIQKASKKIAYCKTCESEEKFFKCDSCGKDKLCSVCEHNTFYKCCMKNVCINCDADSFHDSSMCNVPSDDEFADVKRNEDYHYDDDVDCINHPGESKRKCKVCLAFYTYSNDDEEEEEEDDEDSY